jgi:hypothetical protein
MTTSTKSLPVLQVAPSIMITASESQLASVYQNAVTQTALTKAAILCCKSLGIEIKELAPKKSNDPLVNKKNEYKR